MADPNIRVIRRETLQKHFSDVVPEGLSFIVELPAEVPGSHGANPRTNLKAELERLVQHYV
jgi:hypothetical protein